MRSMARPSSVASSRPPAVRTNFLIDQPVVSSLQRLIARAVNTMLRLASIDSRW